MGNGRKEKRERERQGRTGSEAVPKKDGERERASSINNGHTQARTMRVRVGGGGGLMDLAGRRRRRRRSKKEEEGEGPSLLPPPLATGRKKKPDISSPAPSPALSSLGHMYLPGGNRSRKVRELSLYKKRNGGDSIRPVELWTEISRVVHTRTHGAGNLFPSHPLPLFARPG